METAIWLTEVAPEIGKGGRAILEHTANASRDANPELLRLALTLATGADRPRPSAATSTTPSSTATGKASSAAWPKPIRA